MGPAIDIFGKQVNRTSRLLGVAKPRQIVVSDSIEDNARGWVEQENERKIGFSARQTFVLRGSSRPMSVYFVRYGNRSGLSKSPFPKAEEPAWIRLQIDPPGQVRGEVELAIGSLVTIAHWQLKVLDFSLGPDLFKTVQMPTDG